MDLDYAPRLDGNPYDPEPAGGSVSRLRLYHGAGAPVVDIGPAVRIAACRYRFTFAAPADGNYQASVTWRMSAIGQVFEDSDNTVILPLPSGDPAGLVVSTEDVARDAGIALPLSAENRQRIVDAIREVQADVAGYLNQPITPTVYTEVGLYPYAGGWALLHSPVVEIIAAEPDAYGTYTVTYRAGLDAANDPRLASIRRYVRYHAGLIPDVQRAGRGREISSISVEGQSISYDGRPRAGEPGGPPSLGGLAAFRRYSAFTRDVMPRGVWALR